MGKRTQPDSERQPAGRGSQVTVRKGRELVDSRSPFPVVEDYPASPRWYHRARGAVALTVLVTVIGVMAAVAFTVMLAILVVVAISTIA